MRHCLTAVAALLIGVSRLCGLEPIPDKLVVLTFDDASKSHYTIARPMLLKHDSGRRFSSRRVGTSPPTRPTT